MILLFINAKDNYDSNDSVDLNHHKHHDDDLSDYDSDDLDTHSRGNSLHKTVKI